MYMRVLHINSYYSGSSFYKNLYDKQTKYGLNIDVYVPVSLSFASSSLNFGNYTIIRRNHRKYDRLLFHLKHNKIYKDIIQTYKIENYSIIHAHSLFSNGYIAMKLKQRYGIPYVVAVRNTDVNVFFKYMIHLKRIGIQILKEASKVVFISEPYKTLTIQKYVPAELKKEIMEKSEVIPNGINDFWLNNKVLIKDRKKSEIKLLYVGAINKNKNVLTTIEAIELLMKKGFNATLTIVGKIQDNRLYNKIIEYPFVSYVKPVQKEELINIYRLNDIFIMPSIHETFGLVYAEAMSQGLPVIYTGNQGFDGYFQDGEVGFSVGCFEVEKIAERIIDILDDYEVISKNCLEKCNRFNWDSLTQEYKCIYTSLI